MSQVDEVTLRRQLFLAQAALRKQERLQADLQSTTARLQESQSNITCLQAALAALEGSRTVRIGREVAASLRAPRRMLLWPSIAARLVMRRLRRNSGAVVSAALPGAASISPSVPSADALFARPDVALGLGGEVVELLAAADLPQDMSSFRLALISDRFTADSLAMECTTLAVHPERWVQQLREFRPHLLLVESAWRGLQGEWQGKVNEPDPALCSLVISCREAGIPTVFWNKEDPLHFEAFLRTATLFDQVYTTDAAAVAGYRQRLGHDRVDCLPFAVQPRLHHPFLREGEERLEGSFFAGAWYPHLHERCRDFSELADALSLAGPLVIHDRNGQGGGNNYPQQYADKVRDAVPYEQTGSLYRAYRIGLTLNTIKQSPTMFARRAMELACTNTSIYSNHAQGLATLMGDLVRMTDDGLTMFDWAWEELRNPDAPTHRQRRLLALRKVMEEHTWRHRLETLVQRHLGVSVRQTDAEVVVLAAPTDQAQLDRLLSMLSAQVVPARLVVAHAGGLALPSKVQLLTADARMQIPGTVFPNQWVAVWHGEDTYGPHYLSDLIAACRFGLGDILGKGCFLVDGVDGQVWVDEDKEYCVVDRLAWRRSLAPAERWNFAIGDLLRQIDTGHFQRQGLLSTDRASYACGALSLSEPVVPDQGINQGMLDRVMAHLPPTCLPGCIAGSTLASLFFDVVLPEGVSVSAKNGSLELVSRLSAVQSTRLHSSVIPLAWLHGMVGVSGLTLRCEYSSNFEAYAELLDPAGGRVALLPLLPNTHCLLANHVAATHLRLMLDVHGRQVSYIRALDCADGGESFLLPGDGRLLVVVNGYPRQIDLYRNAFVHRRIKLYQQQGIAVDVIWVCDWLPRHSYSYDGVQVQVCDPSTLALTLQHSRHRAIAVHFLDAMLWSAVREAATRIRTVVWIHGAEAQPWQRRSFLYDSDEERRLGQEQSDRRMAFWREIFTDRPAALSFVFVSRTQARDVLADIGVELPECAWQVIHNPIDTGLFSCEEKLPEDRFRILSIRPHASKVYANDLVAATIRELSRYDGFERLSFTLVGDGPRWDEDFAGLDAFPNVAMRRGFITQKEIKGLHDQHGVFLVPSRADTQGVSRDEAMASGLVPVTTDVGAVAEFVDDTCGKIVQAESAVALAEAIMGLARDCEEFLRLSACAGSRIIETSASPIIIQKELEALGISPVLPRAHQGDAK